MQSKINITPPKKKLEFEDEIPIPPRGGIPRSSQWEFLRLKEIPIGKSVLWDEKKKLTEVEARSLTTHFGRIRILRPECDFVYRTVTKGIRVWCLPAQPKKKNRVRRDK